MYKAKYKIYVIRSWWHRYFWGQRSSWPTLQIIPTQPCFGLQLWYCGLLLRMYGEFHLCWKFDLELRLKFKVTHTSLWLVNTIKSEIWGLGSLNLHKLWIYGGARMTLILGDLCPFSRSILAIFQNGQIQILKCCIQKGTYGTDMICWPCLYEKWSNLFN